MVKREARCLQSAPERLYPLPHDLSRALQEDAQRCGYSPCVLVGAAGPHHGHDRASQHAVRGRAFIPRDVFYTIAWRHQSSGGRSGRIGVGEDVDALALPLGAVHRLVSLFKQILGVVLIPSPPQHTAPYTGGQRRVPPGHCHFFSIAASCQRPGAEAAITR